MSVVLIAPYSDITAMGVRSLSASLKARGVPTRLVFLPDAAAEIGDFSGRSYRYDPAVVEQVAELCSDAALVGVSLFTMYFERVADLTLKLRERISAPVIWGGIHPTVRPEECLQYVDMVCVGEGEEALLELVERMGRGLGTEDVPNIWARRDGGIVRNGPRPLIQDLDALPFPDYDLDDDYVMLVEERRLARMDEGLLREFMGGSPMAQKARTVPYQTMATRGCPHSCTYCCNHLLRKLYAGQRYLRRRSPENIVGELVRVIGRHGFIERVTFSDDSFFAASKEAIAVFAGLYKKEVGLPFFCLGSPLTITAEKLDSLVSAGMVEIQMGIQSASPRTLELYNRSIPAALTEKAAFLINRHREKVMPIYDFLLDNPYEDPRDVVETLRFILKLPRPYILQPFSLVLFPGTVLYDRAKEDGLLADEMSDVYRKQFHIRASSYLNLMFLLLNHGFPRPLMRALLSSPLVWAFNRSIFNPLYAVIIGSYRKMKCALTSGGRVQND